MRLSRLSASGSYLAARHAGTQRDAGAAAAYYRAALRGDPKNPELLERAFLSVLAEGDIEEAVRLAEQVIQLDKNDRIARLVLGVHAIKQKQYAVARAEPHAIGARPDHRSRRDAARRLGAATAPTTPRPRSRRSTSCRAPTGTRCSRTCMPA